MTAASFCKPRTRAWLPLPKSCTAAAGIRGDVLRKERPTGPVFEFSVKDVVEVERLLELFGHTGKEPTLRIRPENFKCQHCVQSFIAAAFLCCGTMTDPEKSYNLEFLSTRHYLSQQLEAMLARA